MIASKDEIKSFLSSPGKIAIVGASTNSAKAGHFVPVYLQKIGFTIIPINPMVDELFGEKTLKSLDELTDEVVGIVIYRKSEIAEQVALKAVDKKIPLIWLPEKIISEKAGKAASEAGLKFVQDKCPMKEGEALL